MFDFSRPVRVTIWPAWRPRVSRSRGEAGRKTYQFPFLSLGVRTVGGKAVVDRAGPVEVVADGGVFGDLADEGANDVEGVVGVALGHERFDGRVESALGQCGAAPVADPVDEVLDRLVDLSDLERRVVGAHRIQCGCRAVLGVVGDHVLEHAPDVAVGDVPGLDLGVEDRGDVPGGDDLAQELALVRQDRGHLPPPFRVPMAVLIRTVLPVRRGHST
ncbi:hypothetical protein O1L60_31200 [Streptomyces diastatochromogenes]|nr:hypothetical protein [Streptomyces diastatochromogenes]